MTDPAETQPHSNANAQAVGPPAPHLPAPTAAHATSVASSRFRIDPILLGLALLVALAASAGAIRASAAASGSRPLIPSLASIIAIVVAPLIFSRIAFGLFSRSVRAANVTFAITLLLGFGIYVARGRSPAPTAAPAPASSTSLAEIRAISEEARKASLDGDEERALKLTAESAIKLDEVAANSKGSEKTVMEYAASLARAQNEVLKQYITAANVYADAGGASLVGLTDPQSIQPRLALLNAALSAHDGVIAYFRTISDRIPRELAAKGIAKKDADEFLAGFVANAKVENLLAIHAAEHGMLLAARRRFDLLAANPGLWSVDVRGDLIPVPAFPASTLEEFHRLQVEIDRLADKQGELIQARKAGG